jgi:hypothetical protein
MSFEINEQDFLKYQRARQSGVSIAKSLGVNYADLVLWTFEHHHKFSFNRASAAFERKAVTLWKAGYTDAEMIEIMGVKKDAIVGWRRRRGLSPNKKDDA